LIDGAQAVPHLKPICKLIVISMFFSGHKMWPNGHRIYIREEVLAKQASYAQAVEK
jgi:selenocysteine lyase/cysteine desulfurase